MSGLKIAKKTIQGVTVGFIVGWPPRPYRWWMNREEKRESEKKKVGMFRNLRRDMIFATLEDAKNFRDSVEAKRTVIYREFEIVG